MRLIAGAISKSYGGRRVLDEVSLTAQGGSAFALMGPSGAGKSTLLGILAGAISPDTGTVRVAENNGVPAKTHWVFQSAPVFDRRSVIDNVILPAIAEGGNLERAREAGYRALHRVGLDVFAPRQAFELSGGQKQRLAIARILAVRAEIVLADEPTASLDRANRDAVLDALLELASAGAVVIVATHDQYVAERCDSTLTLAMVGDKVD